MGKKQALLLISGISEVEYCLDDLKKHRLYKKFNTVFEKIEEFRYQYILDMRTIPLKPSRVLLDPVRLKLDRLKKSIIRKHLQLHIQTLIQEGYEVSLFCHSLGTWVAAFTDVTVKNCWFMGSPIGWFMPFGRFVVRNDISFSPTSKCPLKVKDNFYNLFSRYDKVGNVPILNANDKWGFGARYKSEFETCTKHDFTDYLDWFAHNLTWSLTNV